MSFTEFFSETAELADDARLTAVEHAIGRTLPDDYRALIKETGCPLDLATDATYRMEEWEIPAEVLLFATTEDGMHNCFVINYDHPDYPTGAVLHLNTDPRWNNDICRRLRHRLFHQTRTLQPR